MVSHSHEERLQVSPGVSKAKDGMAVLHGETKKQQSG